MTIASPATEGAETETPREASGADASPAPAESRGADQELPGASALEDRLPEWFRSTKALPLLILPLGMVFLLIGVLPLWHTDLWGHLAYGRLIWHDKAIPLTEPFMPLSRGVELVDTAWLSQVIGYLTVRRFGLPGLQFLAAACFTAVATTIAWLGYRKTGSVGWTVLGLAALLWLNWKQLFIGEMAVIIRPQMAGMVAFTVTLAVVVSRRSWWHWIVIPVTFALWANLHGSFLAGLMLLAVFAIGRGGDVLRRTDRFAAVLCDWPFWRLLLLTELAADAVLLNPYGLRIYADTWLFLKNPNLQDLPEWDPLTLRMFQGQAAAGVALVLLFLYRMTPRRIGTGEVLALILFGGAMLWTSRMIVWWAPLAAYFLTVHAAAVRRTFRGKFDQAAATEEAEPLVPARRSLWTVVSLFLIWIFFGLTPFAQMLLHGQSVASRIQEAYGIQVRDRDGRGALVTGVDTRGAVNLTQFQVGDLITQIDGQNLANAADLDRSLAPFDRLQRTGPVSMTVIRNGASTSLTVTPNVPRPVSRQTALGAAEHLAKAPPVGQVFNALELGDYLIWSSQDENGRPRIATFVASHVHLVPPDVWRAYMETVSGSGWEATLDRYGVNTIVLDKPGQQAFIDRLAEEPAWTKSYDDMNSAVFRRVEPLR